MSVITALFNKSAYSYSDAFKALDKTSVAMRAAIQDWFDLYYQKEPTKEEDPCQQIPYTIVRKLTKTAFCEYNASSDDEYADSVLQSLDGATRENAMQLALIGGECLLKPVPLVKEGRWRWTVVNRANLLVFARNNEGRVTDIGTAEHTTSDRAYFTLLERRTVDENGYLTIRNSLYRSEAEGAIGVPVDLKTLPEYANFPSVYTFPKPVGSVGLVSMKTPIANCVDGSHDGVSVYAAAVGLIHNINRNEAQLNTEFSNGESRVFVSSDLMKKDKDGRRKFSDNIFVGLNDDPESVGVTIFSPVLRVDEFETRKQEYLRNVESVIGLKRGLLSEVEAQEKTATEVTLTNGDYNLTILDLQHMWEQALKEAVRLCGVLGQLYKMPGAHDVSDDAVVVDFGDGVLYNREKVGQELLQQVQMGLLSPERYLGWYYELPCDTTEQRRKIREEYMPEINQLIDE